VNDPTIVNSALYKEVKAIVQELIRDLPEKVAFIVCAHR